MVRRGKRVADVPLPRAAPHPRISTSVSPPISRRPRSGHHAASRRQDVEPAAATPAAVSTGRPASLAIATWRRLAVEPVRGEWPAATRPFSAEAGKPVRGGTACAAVAAEPTRGAGLPAEAGEARQPDEGNSLGHASVRMRSRIGYFADDWCSDCFSSESRCGSFGGVGGSGGGDGDALPSCTRGGCSDRGVTQQASGWVWSRYDATNIPRVGGVRHKQLPLSGWAPRGCRSALPICVSGFKPVVDRCLCPAG